MKMGRAGVRIPKMATNHIKNHIASLCLLTALDSLTRLEFISNAFMTPSSRLERNELHPFIRVVYPAYTFVLFGGEDLVVRMDYPRLISLEINYKHPFFDVQLSQLLGNTSFLKTCTKEVGMTSCFPLFEHQNVMENAR